MTDLTKKQKKKVDADPFGAKAAIREATVKGWIRWNGDGTFSLTKKGMEKFK